MTGRKLIYILLAGALVLSLAGCGQEEKPTLVSDAENVVNRVMELADPNPPTTDTPEEAVVETVELLPELSPEDEPEATPAPETAATAEPDSGEPSQEEPASSEEPGEPLRPGTYTNDAGGVLTVAEDGSCTYETTLPGLINGEELEGNVIFHGTVEDGKIAFTKVTYYGLDITALAAQAGYEDDTLWETEATAIYSQVEEQG